MAESLIELLDGEEVAWSIENGCAKRRQAKKLFGRAVRLTEVAPVEAEASGREALAVAASALYWLEGSDYESTAHDELHRYGAYVRRNFAHGCHLQWDGARYEHRCPVAIAHKRLGFSIGFVGDRLCSICAEDVSECPHRLGRYYAVEGGLNAIERCRVCAAKECTVHLPGETYRARANVVITKGDIYEVSLVSKPVQPDARLTALPISNRDLQGSLGPRFSLGMRVSCDRCQNACAGFDTLPENLARLYPLNADLLPSRLS